ncbi:DEAD/DEAH box helicase [Clostridium manihotivorum]|uniref:ATP-dependent helicase n=1 Tax=Clostridium manihotivorum TaxID=2320868 RepID=A0A3R5QV87_9CLOT|nr:DEAD/DEAH box helicase [Clostridium manihotivorum]QAA33068.1 ATP-dependent helicase [Clostridium manihotivorum]
MNFKELGISEELTKVLKKSGITVPTKIQKESIEFVRSGRDVIAEAQTGTGKTLAFLLPIFENIWPKTDNIQALILTPTRELAIQITEQATKLAEAKNINILSAYGGKDIDGQLRKLKGNIHLIIATPGRLLDHIRRKAVDLSKLKTLVLDEADQMLLMGFKNDVEAIIKETSKKSQILCFSATMDAQVKKLAYRYMKEPITITIKKSNEVTLDNIKQEVVETTDRNKKDALCKVLDEDNPFMAIIFCRTKRRADELEEALHKRGYNCEKLHGDLIQSKREKVMKSFRKAEIQYLIATDLAARGLDVTGVDRVYNYDIPENAEAYIHRIGRTGRAGAEGYTCLFIDPKNRRDFEEIEKEIKYKIPKRNIEI